MRLTYRRTTARLRFVPILIAIVAFSLITAPLTIAEDAAEMTDTLTATEILTRASQQLAATQTVRFDLELDGDTYIDSLRTLKLIEAKGDLVRPDRVRTEFKVEALGQATISIKLIIVAGQWWTSNIITGRWGPAPADFEYDPSVLFDNQGGIGPVMERVTDAQRLDDEKIVDRPVFHIQALVADDIIDDLTANTLEQKPIRVDLWIDRESYDLLRARLAESPLDGNTDGDDGDDGDDPAIWTLDLFDHGANISIDPPT